MNNSFKNLFFLFALTLFFQNCGPDLGSFQASQLSSKLNEEGMNCLSGSGRLAEDCLILNPQAVSRSCEVEHGKGYQLKVDSGWTSCQVTKCDPGALLKGNKCVFTPVTRSCVVKNGVGEQTNVGKGFNQCQVISCNKGFYQDGNNCAFSPIVRTCEVKNGEGEQVNKGNGFKKCEIKSCNKGFYQDGKSCVFSPITRSCKLKNGSGQQTNLGSGFKACTLKSCEKGFHKSGNTCVFTPISRACSIKNGSGKQINKGSGFGSCTIQTCAKGYHKSGNACIFTPITQSCSVKNGTGIKVNKGSGFGSCTVQTCAKGYSKQKNSCEFTPIVKSCNIKNGSGEKTNTGKGFGSCKIKSCNSGFHKEGGSCRTSQKICNILNGEGVQTYSTAKELWGSCKVSSCTKGYEKYKNLCVRREAPKAKVRLFVIRRDDGSGNESWSSEYINSVIEKLTLLTKGEVVFVLESKSNILSSQEYSKGTQRELGHIGVEKAKFASITAIVSQPHPSDSAGNAFSVRHNYEPTFAIQSRYRNGSDQDITNTARVFLHELGHNMGMTHNYHLSVHMDNYYDKTPETLIGYIEGLNACTTESCQGRNPKYGPSTSYYNNYGVGR